VVLSGVHRQHSDGGALAAVTALIGADDLGSLMFEGLFSSARIWCFGGGAKYCWALLIVDVVQTAESSTRQPPQHDGGSAVIRFNNVSKSQPLLADALKPWMR
jgi:ABC-type proline/glycine betaine transport system permease subunit